MKGKTRRKIKRFWKILFPVYGGVISIGCLIVSNLIKPLVENSAAFSKLQMYFPGWYLFLCFWFIVMLVLYIIGDLLFHSRSKASVSEINYFEEINFGKPGENTIPKVINGLLNAEKVEPFYVHAAPKSKEVEIVYSRLKETGFARIYGGPGEGKSMVTYHSAYKFKEEERYYIYRLRVELLEDKTGKEIIDEILFQLDDLKGKRKLIIVDDAHKLAIKRDINIIMQQEAEEGYCKYIWVETEFYEEKQAKIQSDMYIRVDFKEFFGSLLKNFYRSQDPLFQEALKGRIEGLDDAINRVNKGKIHDVWWFAFVASQGEKRLTQEIDNLTDPPLLVLFLISAYTVLSGESELSSSYLLNKLYNFKWGWLTDAQKRSSFSDVIRLLQEQTQVRKSMIRVYDKSEKDRGYIASLHYNFARTVIKASLPRVHLINDLVSSTEELLTSEYYKCAYIGIFLSDIGLHAADFVSKNKDWLISFINNLLLEKLKCYIWMLEGVKNVAVDVYDEIIRKLDIDGIAEKLNGAEAGQFHQLAGLLNAIGDRRNELIKKLDIEQLSKKANRAEAGQFDQLADLLNAIGDCRNELIKELDLEQLSKTANRAEAGQFDQLAELLNAIGDRRNELIKKLDIEQLSKKANRAEAGQFHQLADLLNAIGDCRNELIKELDLEQLSKTANGAEIGQFDQLAQLLNAMGDCRNELIKELDLEQLSKTANGAEIGQFDQLAQLLNAMGDCRNELTKELDLEQLSKTANGAEIGQFDQLAQLLNAIGDRRNELIKKLDIEQLSKKANRAEAGQFNQLAQLLNAMGDCRNKLIEELGLEQLSKTANGAEIGQFDQLANLLDALSFNKNQVSILLDYGKLIQKANQVSTSSDISGLTYFLAKLDEKDRNEFIYKVDWYSICPKIPLYVNFLKPLGSILKNLWKQAESSSDNSRIEKVAKYLKANTSKIIQEIIRANPNHYSGVANFILNCNQIDHTLAEQIVNETMYELVNKFRTRPTDYQGVGQLINAYHEIAPSFSLSFIENDRVKRRIQNSINTDDWSKEIEGLKHLIKAFYRSAPDLWRKMVNLNWIYVDLNSLDLNSIYREVDEEKNVGTAHNTT
jgi:hypothetical protein